MAKEIDTADVEKMFAKLKQQYKTDAKDVKAGYISHDKGKKPYKDKDAPFIDNVALWNEFGTENIPARPFLRRAQARVNERGARILKALMDDGAPLDKALKQIGVMMQGEIKQQITHGTFTPNAPSTIARKGSSRPLVDTGNLLQSVHWGVVKKDGTENIEE